MWNRATLNRATKLVQVPSVDDAKQTFETAIARIKHGAKPAPRTQIPIAVRNRTTVPDDQATEKRALTDAARALAQLWNISPTLVR
jgi:hypothetical protein